MPDMHARFSASSAERWIHCPGSVWMAEEIPDKPSVAAMEGTLAHELAALYVESMPGGLLPDPASINTIKEKVDAFYQEHPELGGSFEEMSRILEPYLDYVAGEYQSVLEKDAAAVLVAEQRVDYSHIAPKGFGIGDVIIIGDGLLEVIDLKYGKGVPVSAVGNPQIRLYALGAMKMFDIYDFDSVKVAIYQPRRDGCTEELIGADELTRWASDVVTPATEAALADDPPFSPGEWCDSHFCPGAVTCRARALYCLGAEPYAKLEPMELDDEELSDALRRCSSLTAWAKKLEDYVTKRLLSGAPMKGWKLIEGMTKRRYRDDDAVVKAAKDAGYQEEMLYKKSLIGITEMEKLMGKKGFNQVLGTLVEKPKGRPTLVPESDPRPEYANNAKHDFAEE